MKRKAAIANLAQRRLQRLRAKRTRLGKLQRAQFLYQVRKTTATDESQQAARELVEKLHAARSAGFLSQYRIAALFEAPLEELSDQDLHRTVLSRMGERSRAIEVDIDAI